MVDALRKEFSLRNVYFFSYDWRLSCEDNAKLLKNFIDGLGSPKVDLVCHSMGGLVASSYYKQNTGSHKINRIVTLATPYEGSPKVLNIVLNKYGQITSTPYFEQWFSLYGTLIKEVKASFRGVAELTPTMNYYSYPNGVMQRFRWPFNLGEARNISYDEYYKLLLDIFGSGNAQMAGWFQKSLHGDGGYNALLDFEGAYFGVGVGQKTILAVKFDRSDAAIPLTGGLIYDDNEPEQGDGTVPYISATMMGRVESLPGDRFRKYNSQHTDIVSNPDAINWVVEIIKGGESKTTASARTAAAQPTNAPNARAANTSGRVLGDRVNCRAEPNTSSRVITQFNRGVILEVASTRHFADYEYPWAHVKWQGGEGWIYCQFIEIF
jgi:triacylglycerol esterase/lipase EstA (alpha/beta hydrolase family)